MKTKDLTKEQKLEIINFYLLPSSAREVERIYALNLYQLKLLLAEFNIQAHSSEVYRKLQVDKASQTLFEKYGVTTTFKCPEILEKSKQTNLERYGTEYALASKEVQKKAKQASIDKYGRDNVGQFGSPEQKNVNRQACKEKAIQTCIEIYGTEYATQSKVVQEKTKQTCLERYGVESVLQCKTIYDKYRQTCLEKYGTESPMQNKEIQGKIISTKRQNNSFNTSQSEENLYYYLCNMYSTEEVIRQYSDERYEFNCDFYIKSIDLFVELNASWTHGKHKFNPDNEEDQKLLALWKSKASDYYKNAIITWTVRDIKKFETAEENKLNYKVIYYDEYKKLIKGEILWEV